MSKIGELEVIRAGYIEKINEYMSECTNTNTLDMILSILRKLA